MSRRLALILAGVLPVVFLVVLGLAIYIPSLLVKPKYDYIYYTGRKYWLNYIYQFNSGKIQRIDQSRQPDDVTFPKVDGGSNVPKLYRHNVSTNTSSEITQTEANKLNLSGDDKSPDGFRFSQNYGSSGPFGVGSSDYRYYLYGQGVNLQQNLKGEPNGYDEVHFLAWVK